LNCIDFYNFCFQKTIKMKKLLLLLLLPLGLFAHGPSSIMAPTVYDLTGAISEGQKVVSLITDQAEIAEHTLTPENNYLTITTPATFYYALLSDSTGVLTCLYLGPQNIGSTELFIEEIAPMPQTPLSAGLKTAGKGTLISLGTGVVIVFAGCRHGWSFFRGFLGTRHCCSIRCTCCHCRNGVVIGNRCCKGNTDLSGE
jgi:hypothetical protein